MGVNKYAQEFSYIHPLNRYIIYSYVKYMY